MGTLLVSPVAKRATSPRSSLLAAILSAALSAGCSARVADLREAHGREQMERLAADRPEILLHDLRGTEAWDWAARKFAGEDLGDLISWNPDPPAEGYPADHQWPGFGREGFIRIRSHRDDPSTPDRRFEDTWYSLVYELNNVSNAREFERTFLDAIDGRSSRREWIERNARLEYRALRWTLDFYREVWIPSTRGTPLVSDPDAWYADLPGSYEAWIQAYTDPRDYPWSFYGDYWDQEVKPYLEAMR
jgi:hypothetical protein